MEIEIRVTFIHVWDIHKEEFEQLFMTYEEFGLWICNNIEQIFIKEVITSEESEE